MDTEQGKKARDLLRAFESDLDQALTTRLASSSCDADESLRLAANMHEMAAFRGTSPGAVGVFERGISILAPHLVSGKLGRTPDVEALFADLVFASHYYMLREYLYYSYNVPDALSWNFSDERVEIKFKDRTIPRQFFTVFNDALLLSRDSFADFSASDQIKQQLQGAPEFVETPNGRAAYALIAQEVDLKLGAYFCLLPTNSDVDLGGYTYGTFMRLYRALLAKALYHRYFAKVNDATSVILIDEREFLDAFEEEEGVPRNIGRLVLGDMVYDDRAATDRIEASYFSLLREGRSQRILMMPHHFAITEGIVNLLRVVAQRRPQLFLRNVSGEMGHRFVQRVKAAWEAEGFFCKTDVSLRDLDPRLPDIDLVVISEEPTLGYVVFLCELKSPIPPRWAKDQLKVLNADSVSKAFRQAEAVRAFMQTDAGLGFLTNMLPPRHVHQFDGFVVAINSLIVTSDNAGMFFGAEETQIVNFRTLERLLKRSDGDVAFIQHVLSTYSREVDETLETSMGTVQIGSRAVAYEAVSGRRVLDFPKVAWRSSAARQTHIDEFIAAGGHPFDVLNRRAGPDGDTH